MLSNWVGWLVVLFYGESTLFGSFNAESSHFDESLFQGLRIFKYLLMVYSNFQIFFKNTHTLVLFILYWLGL